MEEEKTQISEWTNELIAEQMAKYSEFEGLDQAEVIFCHEFLHDFDINAAIRRVPQWKQFHASDRIRQKSRIIKNNEAIQTAIRTLHKEYIQNLHIDHGRVLREYAQIAFSNIDDFVEWNAGSVSVKASRRIAKEKKSAVSEITETVSPNGQSSIKVKLHNKLGALDSLARHLGMFNDKLTLETNVDTVQILNEARERVINAAREAASPEKAGITYDVPDFESSPES